MRNNLEYYQMYAEIAGIFLVTIVLVLLIIIIYVLSVGQQQVISAVDAGGSTGLEAEVFKLVNETRSKGATCGGVYKPPAPELNWNDQLANAAESHSQDMADKNYFSHTSLDGRTFVNRITNAGYTGYSAVGENIAAGYNTANSVMDGWMNSPGHCNNIMNPIFKDLGVGYAYNSGSTYKNYWTQDFGTKR